MSINARSNEINPETLVSAENKLWRWSEWGFLPSFREMILIKVAVVLLIAFIVPAMLLTLDESTLELQKCPACFGVNLCPPLLTGQIQLDSWSQFTSTVGLNFKNIYFGTFRDQKVVLKKLGHNFEHDQLDDYILANCGHDLRNQSCEHVSRAIRPLTRHHLVHQFVPDHVGASGKEFHHLKIFQINHTDVEGLKGSDLLICPSQRKLDLIEEAVFQKNKGIYRLTFIYNMMTMLLFNSEPLIFQAFPAEEGWPFAGYLGSCGRFIVEEYVGPNLAEWLPAASWRDRVNAALQLLLIAQQLNEGVSNLRFYMTDLSLYNVAVGAVDNRLKIIDGENIIVVDLEKIKKDEPLDYDVPYQSDNGGCDVLPADPDCVSFSEEHLCQRLDNDHNLFAVCRQLFRQPSDDFGLMNGLPDRVLQTYPNLIQLQQTCYQPAGNSNRTTAARKLIDIYSAILSNNP